MAVPDQAPLVALAARPWALISLVSPLRRPQDEGILIMQTSGVVDLTLHVSGRDRSGRECTITGRGEILRSGPRDWEVTMWDISGPPFLILVGALLTLETPTSTGKCVLTGANGPNPMVLRLRGASELRSLSEFLEEPNGPE